MPRGRDTEAEQSRISEGEKLGARPAGKTGSGAVNFEKPGYGNGSMQKNPSGSPKDSL